MIEGSIQAQNNLKINKFIFVVHISIENVYLFLLVIIICQSELVSFLPLFNREKTKDAKNNFFSASLLSCREW